jgi:dihydrofolate reductase
VIPKSSTSPTTLFEEIQKEYSQCEKVYIDGGSTIQSFMNDGLIHEMTLTRVPILLGDGIPLFTSRGTTTKSRTLKHISTKSYSNGMVQSSYIVDKE